VTARDKDGDKENTRRESARARERGERERAPIKNDATINYFRARVRASERRWRGRRDAAVR
jgi:hypothetical protein